MPVTDKDLAEFVDEKPIAVTLSAQDIGAMTAKRLTPYDFMQELLARFKREGVPVEGTLHLKLAHGQVFKFRSNPGDWSFTYMWLPEPYVQGIKDAGGLMPC